MKHTPNYRFNLPEKDDAVEINDLNQNFRKIDSLVYNDSSSIKQNAQKIQHLQDKKADISYVDAQVQLAGKVDSVNGKQGDVVVTAKDVKLDTGSSTDVYTSLQSKADRIQTNRDISNLRAESSQHKSDIENLRSVKADKSYVDQQVGGAGKVHSVNSKTGYVTLTGTDINMSSYNRTSLFSEINKKADKSYVDDQMVSAGRVHTVNGKAGSVVLDASDIKMSGSSGNSVYYTLSQKASQSSLNTLRNQVDNSLKIVRNKYIYSSGWSLSGGRYRARVSDSNVTSTSIVDMNIHLDYLDAAEYLYPVTDSHSGGFYIYAKKKPESTIKFDYKVVKEG